MDVTGTHHQLRQRAERLTCAELSLEILGVPRQVIEKLDGRGLPVVARGHERAREHGVLREDSVAQVGRPEPPREVRVPCLRRFASELALHAGHVELEDANLHASRDELIPQRRLEQARHSIGLERCLRLLMENARSVHEQIA